MAMTYTKSVPSTRPLKIYEGTLDPSAIPYATASMAEQAITITGLASDEMVLSFTATDAVTFGIGNARVSAANTLSVVFVATDTDTAVDPVSTINYRLITCPAI